VMTSFLALITNPNLPYQYFHVLAAGLCTAGFLVLGFSAWHLLLKQDASIELFQKSFRWAAVLALIGAIAVGLLGDAHGKFLGKTQPMKIAAAEALWSTQDPADFVLVASIDEENLENKFEVTIPSALSFLLYNRFSGPVEGLNDLQEDAVQMYGPGNYIPPVTISFWSFRIMVGAGLLMLLLALFALLKPRLKFLKQSRLFLKLLLPAMLLPYIASTFGWILTESARQPWIVYGLQRVQDAVSPNVTAGTVLFSLILFTVLLGGLIGITGWLVYKSGTSQPQPATAEK
jgi:cytochrome d ubiquinol oxidase subunit I